MLFDMDLSFLLRCAQKFPLILFQVQLSSGSIYEVIEDWDQSATRLRFVYVSLEQRFISNIRFI